MRRAGACLVCVAVLGLTGVAGTPRAGSEMQSDRIWGVPASLSPAVRTAQDMASAKVTPADLDRVRLAGRRFRASDVPVVHAAGSACVSDPAGDTVREDNKAPFNDPRGDLVEVCADYAFALTLTVKLRQVVPDDPNIESGRTTLAWAIDVDGKEPLDYVALFLGSVALVADKDGDLVCIANGRSLTAGYQAQVPVACLGNPAQVLIAAAFTYDTNPSAGPEAVTEDLAPDTGLSSATPRPATTAPPQLPGQPPTCLSDSAGDTRDLDTGAARKEPRADITQWCVQYGAAEVRFTARVSQPTDPFTDLGWTTPFTAFIWELDTNGDGAGDLSLFLQGIGAAVTTNRDEIQCIATAGYGGGLYVVHVPVECLGSPGTMRSKLVASYTDFSREDSPVAFDKSPNDGTFGAAVSKPTEVPSTSPAPEPSSPAPAPAPAPAAPVGAPKAGNARPTGSFDSAARVPGGAVLTGWAVDPDTVEPINVHIYVNGAAVAGLVASLERPDVAAARPSSGPRHGFQVELPVDTAGPHRVCVYAIDSAGGANALLGCKAVLTAPVGVLDSATASAAGLRVAGWALDPDVAAPIDVHVYVDAKAVGSASGSSERSDLAAAYPNHGGAHGFELTLAGVAAGRHQVCAYAINAGPGEQNGTLGCKEVRT